MKIELTWREKVADFITGGALSGALWNANAFAGLAIRRKKALDDIISMRTPNCAHIGKRMAARAEKG